MDSPGLSNISIDASKSLALNEDESCQLDITVPCPEASSPTRNNSPNAGACKIIMQSSVVVGKCREDLDATLASHSQNKCVDIIEQSVSSDCSGEMSPNHPESNCLEHEKATFSSSPNNQIVCMANAEIFSLEHSKSLDSESEKASLQYHSDSSEHEATNISHHSDSASNSSQYEKTSSPHNSNNDSEHEKTQYSDSDFDSSEYENCRSHYSSDSDFDSSEYEKASSPHNPDNQRKSSEHGDVKSFQNHKRDFSKDDDNSFLKSPDSKRKRLENSEASPTYHAESNWSEHGTVCPPNVRNNENIENVVMFFPQQFDSNCSEVTSAKHSETESTECSEVTELDSNLTNVDLASSTHPVNICTETINIKSPNCTDSISPCTSKPKTCDSLIEKEANTDPMSASPTENDSDIIEILNEEVFESDNENNIIVDSSLSFANNDHKSSCTNSSVTVDNADCSTVYPTSTIVANHEQVAGNNDNNLKQSSPDEIGKFQTCVLSNVDKASVSCLQNSSIMTRNLDFTKTKEHFNDIKMICVISENINKEPNECISSDMDTPLNLSLNRTVKFCNQQDKATSDEHAQSSSIIVDNVDILTKQITKQFCAPTSLASTDNGTVYNKTDKSHTDSEEGFTEFTIIISPPKILRNNDGPMLLKMLPTNLIDPETLKKFMPSEWKSLNYNSTYIADLKETDPLGDQIFKQFVKTTKSMLQVVSIGRVQNLFNWLMYQVKKIEVTNLFGECEELMMFHGTRAISYESICANNFNWRFCGSHKGHKFGKGVSFSPLASYASYYTDRLEKGKNKMFFSRVLVFKTQLGKPGLEFPPEGCDTTVNHEKKVYVKFDDHTFYPEFDITFTGALFDYYAERMKNRKRQRSQSLENIQFDQDHFWNEGSEFHLPQEVHIAQRHQFEPPAKRRRLEQERCEEPLFRGDGDYQHLDNFHGQLLPFQGHHEPAHYHPPMLPLLELPPQFFPPHQFFPAQQQFGPQQPAQIWHQQQVYNDTRLLNMHLPQRQAPPVQPWDQPGPSAPPFVQQQMMPPQQVTQHRNFNNSSRKIEFKAQRTAHWQQWPKKHINKKQQVKSKFQHSYR